MSALLAASAYFTVSDVNIAIVDAVALVVLLIFIIPGIIKGLMNQVLSVLGWVAGIVVAFLLIEPTVQIINNLPEVVGWFNSVWEGIIGEQFASVNTQEALIETLQNSTIPAFLHQSIITLVGDNFTNALAQITATLTNWTITAVSFILLFVLAMFVFAILKKLFKTITSIKGIKQVDKVLGGVLGFVEGLIFLLVFSVLLSIFPWFNEALSPVTETGEPVVCVFSLVYEAVLGLPFIQNFLAGI